MKVEMDRAEARLIETTETVIAAKLPPVVSTVPLLPATKIITFTEQKQQTDEERKGSLMTIYSSLQRKIRFIGNTMFGMPVRSQPEKVLAVLIEREMVSRSALTSYTTLRSLRNQVAHNWTNVDVSSEALDSARELLKFFDDLPRVRILIKECGLSIYKDSAGLIPYEAMTGVRIVAVSPNGVEGDSYVYPTKKNYYSGTEVTWEWEMNLEPQPMYFREINGRAVKAWDGSNLFSGRTLDEVEG